MKRETWQYEEGPYVGEVYYGAHMVRHFMMRDINMRDMGDTCGMAEYSLLGNVS